MNFGEMCCAQLPSHVRLFATLWTVACQASQSLRLSQQEYWSGQLKQIKKKKNTGVGCHFLLQEIFHTQESNPSLLWLLHWLVVSLPLRNLGEIQPCLFSMKLKTSNQPVASAISQLDQEGTCFQARYTINFPALLMYN